MPLNDPDSISNMARNMVLTHPLASRVSTFFSYARWEALTPEERAASHTAVEQICAAVDKWKR